MDAVGRRQDLVVGDAEPTPTSGTPTWCRRWFGDVPRTDVERRATFLAGRFLVLHDCLVTADGATHRYTDHIHTHCGGTGGGLYEPTADGALCTRPGARLSAIVLSPSPAERGAREAIDDEGGWAERTHDVLETSVTLVGGGPAQFLSVLIPEPATVDGYDAVETIRVRGAVPRLDPRGPRL